MHVCLCMCLSLCVFVPHTVFLHGNMYGLGAFLICSSTVDDRWLMGSMAQSSIARLDMASSWAAGPVLAVEGASLASYFVARLRGEFCSCQVPGSMSLYCTTAVFMSTWCGCGQVLHRNSLAGPAAYIVP